MRQVYFWLAMLMLPSMAIANDVYGEYGMFTAAILAFIFITSWLLYPKSNQSKAQPTLQGGEWDSEKNCPKGQTPCDQSKGGIK